MRSRFSFILVIMVVAAALLAPTVLAGQLPAIYSVSEGRDPGTDRPTLSITGKGLTKLVSFDLAEAGTSTPRGAPDIVSRKSSLLVLRLPADLEPGAYVLTVADKAGISVDLAVNVQNGEPLPGTVGASALDGVLRTDLDDAETLDGQPGSFYLDLANLSGVLSTGAFSAYGDLTAEGKLGTGTGQVAEGDHVHPDYVTQAGAFATFSMTDHEHDATYRKRAMVGAKVHLSAAYPIVKPGSAIPFDAEAFDPDGSHDNVLNPERLTCQEAGYYLVTARMVWVIADGDPTKVEIRKNGVAQSLMVDANVGPTDAGQAHVFTAFFHMDAGDYLEMYVYNNAGTNYEARAGAGNTELYMVHMGE